MNTNNYRLSPTDACDSILNHIINCASCALKGEDTFHEAMISLAHEFRTLFDSEYCAIGTVVGGIAEDSAIDFQISGDELKAKKQVYELKFVRSKPTYDDDTLVSKGLKSPLDISLFDKIEFFESRNYDLYSIILDSGKPENSIVIPIRDNKGDNFGYIQFMNTNVSIDYERYIQPYKEALLGLVQIIINNRKNQQELIKKKNLLKEADFYNLMQNKRDNVDELLDSIMAYFSKEFNAAVVSFRVPLLNGPKKEPLFYLRRVFIHPSIKNSILNELIHRYGTERLVKSKNNMNIVDELRCDLVAKVFESKSDSDFSQKGLDLDNNTLIIPIFGNFEQKCIHPQRIKFEYCKDDEHLDCKYRFKRLYGIFRLRISKTDLANNSYNSYHFDLEETKERLGYLSKQITLLINSIVNRFENESLTIFQNELRNSSFIKIKDFDERCVEIIRNAVHAKVCSIYRYDEQTRLLSLNATTAKKIRFIQMNEIIETNAVINNCYFHIKSKNNALTRVFERKETEYILNMQDTSIHESHFIENVGNEQSINNQSAMVIPMLKKDGSCAGIVLLLGKEEHKHSISTAYWEHDVKHIEFIVNILTRISESDTERLTFLSRLSHELLAPVTELVYDNDLTVNIAERNRETFSRQQLIQKLRENIDRNMIFKYIISDTEFIYSTSKRNVKYNIVKQNHPVAILLDAIYLLEKEAHHKGLEIRTNISKMPPLYFDKERMMQVFINLLKNAIRYSNDGTTINIYYKFENNIHEIRFTNYGIGIQEKEKESIFDLFHRGEEAKKKVIRGTGLGLSIVRDIMRAHGGDCYVRQLNNPTEFVITLPI